MRYHINRNIRDNNPLAYGRIWAEAPGGGPRDCLALIVLSDRTGVPGL